MVNLDSKLIFYDLKSKCWEKLIDFDPDWFYSFKFECRGKWQMFNNAFYNWPVNSRLRPVNFCWNVEKARRKLFVEQQRV